MNNDLISRSALKDALKYWTHFPEHRGGKSVYDIIDDAPAVDAVEVVRCRDCKHWDKEPDEREGCCFGIADGTMLTEPDEFCSRGERRADDD